MQADSIQKGVQTKINAAFRAEGEDGPLFFQKDKHL